MFQNLNVLLRTLVLGVLVAIVGWWTLFLKAKVADGDAKLQRSQEQVTELATAVETRDARILELGATIESNTAEIRTLEATVAEKEETIQALDVALELLKVSTRIARIRVLSQEEDAGTGEVHTTIEFTEMGPDGEPVGTPRRITIAGRKVYLESWVVKFEDSYVEEGDPLRGTSICLFRRVFGENERPIDGATIDPVGEQPLVYGGETAPDPLHEKIWKRFWDYANDPGLASGLGVRALHGEAPFIETRPGKTYWVELRASDGLTIRTE